MENHPAYKYAIRILSKRDYSRAKIRQKLIDREYHDVAEELIELLVEKRFLREDFYIESRIKGLMKKNYSPSYIISKLKEEQLDVNLGQVNMVFDEFNTTAFDQIETLIRKKSLLHNWTTSDLEEQSNKVKLIRFLQSKGHNWHEIGELL